MNKLSLYKKRFIPNELIHLQDDIILVLENNLIITKWRPLRPKTNMYGVVSAYYIDMGIKVSKIYDKKNKFLHWYCDIIQHKQGANPNSIIFKDLLIDVVIRKDGSILIMDTDELADALDLNLITVEEAKYALRTLDSLLKLIYRGEFKKLQTR